MAGNVGEAGGLVGRATELATIEAFLDATAAGSAGSLVISGDPGVGKTALVQRACTAAGTLPIVFAGAALPLTSLTVPFLALRAAFRQTPTIDGAEHPAPRVPGDSRPDVPVMIDTWLDELCSLKPVVLFIDDLHWADLSTLDVLMYLMAGPADRRLAIFVTLRSGEVEEGHPLQRWLADIRRLPRVEWLALEPFDRADTELQLADLLDAPPHQSLVQEIFTHTAGNAYLNRLLAVGLHSGTRHLPAGFPPDLKAAVLRSWFALSPGAQALTRLMSVGGRPLLVQDLDAVLSTAAPDDGALPLLREGANAGILECSADGMHWWFHHPLMAEALLQGMDGDERKRRHAAFAAQYEDLLAGDEKPDFQTLAALADHYYFAGQTESAYRCALRASTAAGRVGGTAEMLRLIRRALSLRGGLPNAPESVEDLWSKLRMAAEEAGAQEDELEAVNALLARLDRGARPLDVAELLVRRTFLRFTVGQAFMDVEDPQEAVRLAAVQPGSWQYALALAELAHAGLWHDLPEAPSLAVEALRVARGSENPRALSFALTANAMAALNDGRAADCRDLAAQAMVAASQAGDFLAYSHATMWQANATASWSSRAFAELMGAGRQQLLERGAPHSYIATLAASEAGAYLAIGQWRECADALRLTHGADHGAMVDIDARLSAARLASWQGRQSEAEAHLARADELCGANDAFLNLSFSAIRAEVYLSAGNPQAAYEAAITGATSAGVLPTMCEWLVPLAARSLADEMVVARDAGESLAAQVASLDELEQRFPVVLREVGDDTETYLLQLAALNMLYVAEIGRAREGSGNPEEWNDAADALHRVSFLWEEAYACWRGAESTLLHGHSHGPRAAGLLRRGLRLAQDLHAIPLEAQLVELAVRARIDTTRPDLAISSDQQGELPGLTPREREILVYVIAGRTYAEIARELTISQKTVSSHISNLLRKTGAANRIDLARLAARQAAES